MTNAVTDSPLADIRKFLDLAAGEGIVLDGIDAANLYLELFGDEMP